MCKFKIGDTVMINDNIDMSSSHFGDATEMYDMRGRRYEVMHVNDDEVVIEHYSFHESDLTPCTDWEERFDSLLNNIKYSNESTFIESVIDGELVYNPVDGGNNNGKFIGYAIELDSEDENGSPIKVHTIIDANGQSVANCDLTHIYLGWKIRFALQPEEVKKTKMHSVAFVVANIPDHHWYAGIFSDTTLNAEKYKWKEYRILETWYE